MTLLDTFPHLKEYNFPAQEISPTLFKTFSAAVANRITTLNLLPMARQTYSTRAIPLRNILCTFEHLVHLRAPTAEYLLDDMDLNDIRGQLQKLWIKKHVDATSRSHPRIAQDDPAVARQYVWVCRGLRTLHMKVDYHGTDCDFSELSLIVFGFLSRMCPRLQELSLKRRSLDLSLQGGLCLLTRLQELERVRIITHHYPQMDERDLLWIPSTPLSTWDRLYYPLLRHSTCKDLQAQYKGISPDKTTGSKLVERGRELGMDLSKVGYPEDLLDWMEERYGTTAPVEGDYASSSFRSLQLPKMQSFSVECREKKDKKAIAAQKLEDVVAKVRPNVHFRMCEEHKDAFYETTLKYW
ncbi:hypothetical protein BGX24_001344 [Mortierella sp. AD032]|nr:hypothetical protein BGX24_001344 [Mortierella sp. AD032]